MRVVKMGTLIPAGRDAPLKLAEALKNGQHVGMLVDQYLTNGVEVTFFGRKTRANPMLARLLWQIECPIHGVRIIRLPGHRFRAELSEEVKAVRDAAGQIDIQGTMQAVTSVIEGWIREYPDQWLCYTDAGGSTCSTRGPHPGHTVQLGNAAVNLTDHALRERPEVHVQRHQHDDITQRF